ncbi:adenine deaminase C-terminal domain-containing protein [Chloroflexota bacterium]
MQQNNLPWRSEETLQQIEPVKIKTLIDTALGKTKADIVVAGADLVNVYSGEVLRGQSVAIKGARIAFVGDRAEHTIGPGTRIIDATGKILIPGLIDPHTHPVPLFNLDEFLKYAMIGGTTTIVSETVELVIPMGYRGVQEFLKAAGKQPVKIFVTVGPVPSLSPSSKLNFLRPEKLRRLLKQKNIVGQGEIPWPFVVDGDGEILQLYAETLKAGKQIVGHSAGARGSKLQAYVASGVSSCHEPTTAEEVMERLRLGLHVMIREGDIRRDLEVIASIKDKHIDFRRLVFCTDGMMPSNVMKQGYMESVVQKAIDLGFDPIVAIQMATINPAEYFCLDNLIGGIAPGKCADMVILTDLRNIEAEMVISNGRIIAQRGKILVPPIRHHYPKSLTRIVPLPRKIKPADFKIRIQGTDKQVTVRVINQVTDIVTREEKVDMTSQNGFLEADSERDLLKVAFIDRASNPGKMFTGFIKGFGMKKGAFASSAPWDLSGIIVVGARDEDMAGAVNRIITLQGGTVVYNKGQVLAELPLTIAGYISDLPTETVNHRSEEIQHKLTELGTSLLDANLTLTALTTSVIPFLRICESGLMDIGKGELVDLIL